jgi:hypothetical protein
MLVQLGWVTFSFAIRPGPHVRKVGTLAMVEEALRENTKLKGGSKEIYKCWLGDALMLRC